MNGWESEGRDWTGRGREFEILRNRLLRGGRDSQLVSLSGKRREGGEWGDKTKEMGSVGGGSLTK